MKLDSLLSRFSPIRLADESDSDKLNRFFGAAPMSSSALQLSYERHPDFFSFLRFHSDETFVFCAEDEDGKVLGVATLLVREGYVDGRSARVGYLADLRVAKDRPDWFTPLWKECMGEVIGRYKSLKELSCDYLITAIMAGNKAAKRSLVNQPKNKFHYEKISSYKMVNIIHGFGKLYRGEFKTSRAGDNDLEEVLTFLEDRHRQRPFGLTRAFVERALRKWPGMGAESFVVCRSQGRIVAAAATWNPSPYKKIILKKAPLSLRATAKLASFFTLSPRTGEELKVQYLNFLDVETGCEEALVAIVDYLKREGVFKRYHMLAFSDFEQRPLGNLLSRCVTDVTDLELYQVVHKDFMEDLVRRGSAPGFEISLV